MTPKLNLSVVRIYGINRQIVGAGFLVSQGHILTCAHVIASALGLKNTPPKEPHEQIQVDFPGVDQMQIFTAKVISWKPIKQNSQTGLEELGDIAVLKLDNAAPNGAQPLSLLIANDWLDHDFQTFGFPIGQPGGVFACGKLLDKNGDSWVQIQTVRDRGIVVKEGFSGAPIWDQNLNGVVGMTVGVANRQALNSRFKGASGIIFEESGVAFMIPTNSLVEAYQKLVTLGAVPNYREIKVDGDKTSFPITIYLPKIYLCRFIAKILNINANYEAKRSEYQEVDIKKLVVLPEVKGFRIVGNWDFRFRENGIPVWMSKRGEFYQEIIIDIDNEKLNVIPGEHKLSEVSGENDFSDGVFRWLPLVQIGLKEAIKNFVNEQLREIDREINGMDIRELIIKCVSSEVASILEMTEQELKGFLYKDGKNIEGKVIEGGILITLLSQI